MKDLAGKVAFITGGASGMGFGMAHALAEAGMSIAIVDIRAEQLARARAALERLGAQVLALPLDVSDRAAYARVAEQVETALGPVQLLCNNAGIGLLGSLKTAKYDDWDWVLGVNLGGAINGIQTFLPRMLAHGQGGHIVSTASAAGLFAGAGAGIYTTSKMAVVGMMECLRGEIAAHGIGVSVLCPHLVRTQIHLNVDLRPERFGNSGYASFTDMGDFDPGKVINEVGMDPIELGQRVLEGIKRNDLYILTHPEIEPIIRERFEALLAALPNETPDPRRVAAEAATLHYSVYTEHKDKPAR